MDIFWICKLKLVGRCYNISHTLFMGGKYLNLFIHFELKARDTVWLQVITIQACFLRFFV